MMQLEKKKVCTDNSTKNCSCPQKFHNPLEKIMARSLSVVAVAVACSGSGGGSDSSIGSGSGSCSVGVGGIQSS